MQKNPLANPGQNSTALGDFTRHFRLERREPEALMVESVAAAFSSRNVNPTCSCSKRRGDLQPLRSRDPAAALQQQLQD